jgi:hypothetical protein
MNFYDMYFNDMTFWLTQLIYFKLNTQYEKQLCKMFQIPAGVHADRTASGHRDHCNSGGDSAAGLEVSQGKGPTHSLSVPLETNGFGAEYVFNGQPGLHALAELGH